MMLHEDAAEMFAFIAKNNKEKARDVLENAQNVQNLSDYGKIISLLYEELYANLEFIELEYEAARLQVRVIEHFVKEQKSKITAQLQGETSVESVTKLLQNAKKLDQLLKSVKENARGK